MQVRKAPMLFLIFVLASLFSITPQAFAVRYLRYLYDDFSAGSIDVHRWPRGMLVREIRGGALTSELSALANRSNYIMFKNPESVNSIQATVTVTEAGLLNQQSYGVYAQIAGNFYKGLNGDIFAGVCIGQQVDQGLEAWWVFYDGSDWQVEVLVPPDDPNPLLLNTPYVAKIEYNGFNGFTFTVDGRSGNHTGPTRHGPAANHSKDLSTGIYGDQDVGGGWISAKFDDVSVIYVGKSDFESYDNFDAPLLDPTKWMDLEEVRQVVDVSGNYKLRSEIRETNKSRSVTSLFRDNDAPYIEAKVSVSSASQFTGSTNKMARARIAGWYFNTRRGPGSGQPYDGSDGDVWVALALRTYDTGSGVNIRAEAQAEVTNRNQTTWDSIFPGKDLHIFSKSISFGTEYILSIEFTSTSLIFTVKDSDGSNPETFMHNFAAAVYEPSTPNRHLSCRAYASGDGDIYLKAYFDDVYVWKIINLVPMLVPLLMP